MPYSFNACDVTIANSKYKILNSYLTYTSALPSWKGFLHQVRSQKFLSGDKQQESLNI